MRTNRRQGLVSRTSTCNWDCATKLQLWDDLLELCVILWCMFGGLANLPLKIYQWWQLIFQFISILFFIPFCPMANSNYIISTCHYHPLHLFDGNGHFFVVIRWPHRSKDSKGRRCCDEFGAATDFESIMVWHLGDVQLSQFCVCSIFFAEKAPVNYGLNYSKEWDT